MATIEIYLENSYLKECSPTKKRIKIHFWIKFCYLILIQNGVVVPFNRAG
jgi:hypothetical protein